MTTFVRTVEVPDDTPYLTADKIYEVREGDERAGWITADFGGAVYIYFASCAHLNGLAWTVIETKENEMN